MSTSLSSIKASSRAAARERAIVLCNSQLEPHVEQYLEGHERLGAPAGLPLLLLVVRHGCWEYQRDIGAMCDVARIESWTELLTRVERGTSVVVDGVD